MFCRKIKRNGGQYHALIGYGDWVWCREKGSDIFLQMAQTELLLMISIYFVVHYKMELLLDKIKFLRNMY